MVTKRPFFLPEYCCMINATRKQTPIQPKECLRRIAGIAVLLLFSTTLSFAQGMYKTQQASVTMAGTSSLHDWTMTAEGFPCTTSFVLENGRVTGAKAVALTVPVKTLKSGKSAMDKNAYSALKEDAHKQISYSLATTKLVGDKLVGTGSLTIAGVTKPIEIASLCTLQADQSIVCKSTVALKMTDFGVEPPSFMFGSITTGDNITLEFNLVFKKTN
jgi:hypothetical protein